MANNFLFCSFYYKSNLKTGANKRFENIISAFAKHISDDQRIIVLIKKGNISDRFIHDKIDVHEVSRFPFFDRLFTFVSYSFRLMSYKKMIVVTDFMPVPLLALSKHLHFQLIHDIRNFTKFKRVDLFSFGKIIQKMQWKKCQNIITVSDFTKKELTQKCKIEPEKIIVSPNGIDRSYLPVPSNNNRDIDILYIATFEKRKNHQLLVEALEKYSGIDRLRVCLIGKDLGTKDQIISSINLLENNIDVDVIDHVGTESELIGYYDRSNLFVSPSLYEGFGMPLVEALSRGCKVLCTDIEVFREVGRDHVEYFSPDDPAALLRLILDTLNRPKREMIDKKFFESYKWSNIARDLVSYFNEYKVH